MSIVINSVILEHQLFVQRDGRDPLGVWGHRGTVVGDASGGTIKQGLTILALGDAGRIYTCYSVAINKETGVDAAAAGKVRLLTNFPPMDRAGGTTAFGSARRVTVNAGTGFSAPILMIDAGDFGITPQERFVLLFGPQAGANVNIVELEINENEDLAVYTFEGYGYFWDRQVLYVAGGPRHPGEGQ